MLELHVLTGKNILPVVKNKKLKKGERCATSSCMARYEASGNYVYQIKQTKNKKAHTCVQL
jgi:hypothetical protein